MLGLPFGYPCNPGICSKVATGLDPVVDLTLQLYCGGASELSGLSGLGSFSCARLPAASKILSVINFSRPAISHRYFSVQRL